MYSVFLAGLSSMQLRSLSSGERDRTEYSLGGAVGVILQKKILHLFKGFNMHKNLAVEEAGQAAFEKNLKKYLL